MNRTAGEMIEYLKEFDTESKCKVLVADPERRKRYDVEAAVVIDADAPILCLKVCKICICHTQKVYTLACTSK